MIGICAMPIENVLALGTNLKTAQPTKWARSLYDSLHHEYRMIAFTQADNDLANWWLKREMLRDWAAVMTQPDHINLFAEWKLRQIEDFLAEGWDVGMFIDTEPLICTAMNELGVMSMLLCQPIRKIGWKDPTEPPRPWTTVTDTI